MAKDVLYPLRCLHGKFHDLDEKWKLRRAYRRILKEQPKTVFLVLTPEHGNLGDHAIAQAEIDLLTRLGIDYIEITGRKLYEMMCSDRLDVFNGAPILINGGGNLGTLWMDVENIERAIIQKNPKSHVLVLPNTVFYEKTDWGREELHKSIQIYNRHQSLSIYAREQTSYDFMKPIYRDVRLVPDMVLSMKKDGFTFDRKGCLLCLRNDREKTRTTQDEEEIRKQVAVLFGDHIADTDMVVSGTVSVERRAQVLEEKFAQFSGAELVITDRLHGMIFCAITGTPCIVINSMSPKVRGCYEWIKHLDYIRFVDKPEDIITAYRTIPEGSHHYDNSHLAHYYESLAEDIQNIWR